jgi:glycosyltransferase involved in cell wall biosynthesis
MLKTGQIILIACDSAKSLIDFRGKLIEEMVKQHTVHVFTPVLPKAIREKLTLLKVTIHENQLSGSNVSILADIKYLIMLYKLMKKIKPDVFFPYTFKPVIYGTVLAKIHRIKCIAPMLSGLGYNFSPENKKSFVSRITRLMLRFSLIKNKRLYIIFQNKDDYQTLLSYKILNDQHQAFVVNGSGVDLEYYQYTPPDTKNISFIMISRLINAKGIHEYFEAARLIRLKYPDIQFKLIGSYADNIDAISPDLYLKIKNGDNLQYLGEVDDVRPHIKDASVVVLPSYYGEGVPRCLLESMAMGRAIITSDSVGCRETVNPESPQNGFLIPIKNIPELMSKMEFYIKDSDAIYNYGLNGLAFAKNKFDVTLINDRMLSIMKLK